MLEVARDNCKGLKLFYRLHKLLFDRGTAALNVSTVRLKLLGCVSRYQWDIVRGKNDFFYLCWALQEGITKTGRGIYVSWLSQDLSFLVIATFSFVVLFLMTSLRLSFKTVPVHVATCQQHQIATSQILMVYTQNVCTCCIVVVGTHSRRFPL